MDRRKFEASVGAVIISSLAGCVDSLTDSSTRPDDLETPEETIRVFWEAHGDNIDTQRQLLHENSHYEIGEEGDVIHEEYGEMMSGDLDITANNVDTLSLTEAWEDVPDDSLRFESKEDLEEYYMDILDGSGTDDFLIAEYERNYDGSDSDGSAMLVSDNDNWFIWHFWVSV